MTLVLLYHGVKPLEAHCSFTTVSSFGVGRDGSGELVPPTYATVNYRPRSHFFARLSSKYFETCVWDAESGFEVKLNSVGKHGMAVFAAESGFYAGLEQAGARGPGVGVLLGGPRDEVGEIT